jgi:hypothetical protein
LVPRAFQAAYRIYVYIRYTRFEADWPIQRAACPGGEAYKSGAACPHDGALLLSSLKGDLETAKQLFNLFKAYFPTKFSSRTLKRERLFPCIFLHDLKIIWFLASTRKL